MEPNRYEPITRGEYIHLREFLSQLGYFLPDDKAGYVWGLFNRLRNVNEPQPCTCPSAGVHWKRAIDYLTDWVKERK